MITKEEMAEMNKDDLKAELRERTLPVSGRREDLEARLLAADSADGGEPVVVKRDAVTCPGCGADELEKRYYQKKMAKTIHIYATNTEGRQRVRYCRCRGCARVWQAREQIGEAELKARAGA